MRTYLSIALLGLTACQQTLPPQDEETTDPTTSGSNTNITTATLPSNAGSTTDETPTTTASSTGDDTTGTSTTDEPITTTLPVTTTGTGTTGATTTGTTADTTGGTTVVAVCGDGVAEGDETCDDGDLNNDVLQGKCRTDCQLAGCGDGVVDFVIAEGCDDGNADDGDGCSATCAVEAPAACGDGVVDLSADEVCDDGNTVGGDGCSAACTLEVVGATCGDGAKTGLEVCDDSNVVNGDGCNPTCSLKNTTSLFVGTVGTAGITDGVGPAAKISGTGAMVVVGPALYLADGTNHAIRKIDLATGTVTTIAGSKTGVFGYGDNAVGTMAKFNNVQTITSDGTTLYVGESEGARLRAVSLTAPYAVTSLAGNGMKGLADGFGAAAQFDDIRGLTWYGGAVYLLDSKGAVLRRYDPAEGKVETLAGEAYVKKSEDGVGAAARFIGPRHMTADSSGLLFIADSDGSKVRTYHTVTGYVGTLIGTGTLGYVDGGLADALVARPRGLVSDGTSVYFAELTQHTIRQVVLATQEVSTNVGTDCDGMMVCVGGYMEGTGTAALFDGPYDVTYDVQGKTLYVLDSGNKVIRKLQ